MKQLCSENWLSKNALKRNYEEVKSSQWHFITILKLLNKWWALLSLENTMHQLQVPHIDCSSTIHPFQKSHPRRELATARCRTSPALQAALGKPAYTQCAGVRTTHEFKIFPFWGLMASAWLTLMSPHPEGIHPLPISGTAQEWGIPSTQQALMG